MTPWPKIAKKILSSAYRRLKARARDPLGKSAVYWDSASTADAIEYWGNVKGVREFIWKKVTGSPDITWYTHMILKQTTPFGRVLCFGDGYGMAAEAHQRKGDVTEVVYLNISRGEGHRFEKRLEEVGFRGHHAFVRADANEFDFRTLGEFDTVCDVGAFHHFEKLEGIFSQVNSILKEDGLVYVDEFVGPSRFGFSQGVIDCINRELATLPSTLVACRGEVCSRDFAAILEKGGDCTESIRSGELDAALRRGFRLHSLERIGGTLLYPFFLTCQLRPPRLKIGNFYRTPEGAEAVARLLALEAEMIDRGDWSSDYGLYVFGKKR